MAFLQWRRFNFFEKELVKLSEENVDKIKDIEIVACTSGKGHIIFGDSNGFCYFVNRQMEIFSFKAYEIRLQFLEQLRQNAILVSIGEDEPGVNPLIKVWNLDKIDRNGDPHCARIARAIPGNNPTAATALAVHENLTYMAVGFQDGSVVLFKGDITRNRHGKSKLIHDGQHTVTGLTFRSTLKQNHLFVVTLNDVYSYNLAAKEKEQKCHIDTIGCSARCTTMTDSKHDNQLVVARKEAVYFFQPDDRGQCLGFEGEKLIIHWFRGYLIVVGRDSKAVSTRPSTSTNGNVEMNTITIYDVQNKFIAYCAPIPDVIDIISEWGFLYVLCRDQKLYHLMENDTQSKLETLFKKNLYVMAIQLAKGQQYDEDGLMDIFRQYGDHLYSKGDHDGAVSQYIKTIGKLEASYVIQKFLDAQRIHNLTAYLQALHKKGLATEDHTTLLLNCYTKLKDLEKLDEFIMTKDREVDFNVDIAIKVCRSAGYYKHALFLAEKHEQHDWYLKIQLEDHKDYQKALNYIGKLKFNEAGANMKKYGKILISEIPEETTEFLKRLCTDYRPSDELLVDPATLDGSPSTVSVHFMPAEEFIHIFVNNTRKLTEFLEHMVKVQPNSKSAVYNTLLEVYIREFHQRKEDQSEQRAWEHKIMSMLQQQEAGYDLDQALVLCQVNSFSPGILVLYEKAKLYQQILQYNMENKDSANVFTTCQKFGSQDPSLWIRALRYFVNEGSEVEQDYLNKVLSVIEKKKLLPPLMVIDIMASSGNVTLGNIKKYMIQQLQQENDQIAEDERLISQYKEETEKMRNQMEEIKTSARIFQVSKCCTCNHMLELPSVHFLCQHSYHQHCFESYAESDSECIVCLPQNRKIMDTIRAQENSRDMHEQFHHQLERAEDGFSVVAEYFGRGIFSTPAETNNSNVMPLITGLTTRTNLASGIKPKLQEPSLINQGASRSVDDYSKNLNPFER